MTSWSLFRDYSGHILAGNPPTPVPDEDLDVFIQEALRAIEEFDRKMANQPDDPQVVEPELTPSAMRIQDWWDKHPEKMKISLNTALYAPLYKYSAGCRRKTLFE